MIHILLKQIRQLFTLSTKNDLDNKPKIVEEQPNITNSQTETLADTLNTACAKITIYIREDGEFAVTTEFDRSSEEVMNVTGTVLHMINSGSLADYFLKSLHLWATENDKDNLLVRSTIKKWKALFDEEKTTKNPLAIDPSDVFALKSMSQKDD